MKINSEDMSFIIRDCIRAIYKVTVVAIICYTLYMIATVIY